MGFFTCSLCGTVLMHGDWPLSHLGKHLEVKGSDDALKVLACASFGTVDDRFVSTFGDRPHYRHGAKDRQRFALYGLLYTEVESIEQPLCTPEQFYKRVIAFNKPSALFEEVALAVAIGQMVTPVIVEPRTLGRPVATLQLDLIALKEDCEEQLDDQRFVGAHQGRFVRLEGFDDPPSPEGHEGAGQEP